MCFYPGYFRLKKILKKNFSRELTLPPLRCVYYAANFAASQDIITNHKQDGYNYIDRT